MMEVELNQNVLEKAIVATQNTIKAMVKELAAGPGKARYHAETFNHAVDALERLNGLKEKPRAAKKKPAVKQD